MKRVSEKMPARKSQYGGSNQAPIELINQKERPHFFLFKKLLDSSSLNPCVGLYTSVGDPIRATTTTPRPAIDNIRPLLHLRLIFCEQWVDKKISLAGPLDTIVSNSPTNQGLLDARGSNNGLGW